MMTQSFDKTLEQFWYVETASEIGFMHIRNHMPLQDSISSSGNFYSEGGPIFLAVADGHGDISHFRSSIGASIATSLAVEVLQQFANKVQLASQTEKERLVSSDNIVETVLKDIVTNWKIAILDHLANNPFNLNEIKTIKAHKLTDYESNPTVAYGTTLIGCTIIGSVGLFVQIGDGDVVVMASNGDVYNPIPIDPSLVSNRTTSLCQKNPIQSFRMSVINVESTPIDMIMLSTDGFGNSQIEPNWYKGVLTDIASFSQKHGMLWVRENLPNWAKLCASREGSGDDTTVGLIVSEQLLNRHDYGGEI